MAFLKPSKFLTLSLCFRAFFKVLHALFTDFSFPLFCIELMGRWKHGGSDKKVGEGSCPNEHFDKVPGKQGRGSSTDSFGCTRQFF